LRLINGDGSSFISAPKMEVLLVVLLIRADELVTVMQLVDEIWGNAPPRRAHASLHVYVSRLRKFLEHPGRTDSPILTRPSGYLLRMSAEDQLDVDNFVELVAVGREDARAGKHESAAACFEQALALWRGPVLAGLPRGPIVDRFLGWLAEVRLECLELLMEAHLHQGRHREVVARLHSLVAEYPLCEAFYRQLMLALYRSERQAEALSVYDSARRTLTRELGLEPGRPLRNLHRAILTADCGLDCYIAV
jgi:DNA-binding SARP family transcriptional activator